MGGDLRDRGGEGEVNGRREITCRRRGQVNVRYSGASGWLLNPLWSSYCTACQTHLQSGVRTPIDRIRGLTSWSMIYGMHLFVGAGGGVLVAALLIIIWPPLLTLPAAVRAAPILAGAILGGVTDERARRRGTLLTSRRADSKRRRSV